MKNKESTPLLDRTSSQALQSQVRKTKQDQTEALKPSARPIDTILNKTYTINPQNTFEATQSKHEAHARLMHLCSLIQAQNKNLKQLTDRIERIFLEQIKQTLTTEKHKYHEWIDMFKKLTPELIVDIKNFVASLGPDDTGLFTHEELFSDKTTEITEHLIATLERAQQHQHIQHQKHIILTKAKQNQRRLQRILQKHGGARTIIRNVLMGLPQLKQDLENELKILLKKITSSRRYKFTHIQKIDRIYTDIVTISKILSNFVHQDSILQAEPILSEPYEKITKATIETSIDKINNQLVVTNAVSMGELLNGLQFELDSPAGIQKIEQIATVIKEAAETSDPDTIIALKNILEQLTSDIRANENDSAIKSPQEARTSTSKKNWSQSDDTEQHYSSSTNKKIRFNPTVHVKNIANRQEEELPQEEIPLSRNMAPSNQLETTEALKDFSQSHYTWQIIKSYDKIVEIMSTPQQKANLEKSTYKYPYETYKMLAFLIESITKKMRMQTIQCTPEQEQQSASAIAKIEPTTSTKTTIGTRVLATIMPTKSESEPNFAKKPQSPTIATRKPIKSAIRLRSLKLAPVMQPAKLLPEKSTSQPIKLNLHSSVKVLPERGKA